LTEMKAIRYLKHHKIPYIFAINGGIVRDNDPQWKARLKRKYLPGAKAYLSPDEHSSSYLTYYGVDPSKIKLFPYSTIFEKEITEKPLPAIEKKAEREKEGIPGEELYLSVGSFIPRKNDQELLSLWTKTGKEKTLMLIGEGEEKARYQSFIQEHQLNNVLIRPFMPHSEILRYFRMADASIFLTKEDVYGHVVNECLSQGTPVIASDKANSARKLVQNGVDGYLVDITNEQELLKVFASPLTEQMGQNAIQTARQNTIEEMTSAHLKIFEEYLKA
jgi:glycosyltransferase involved in cell wall biosynthesis